ncbi:MAG: hypothetical protein ACFFFC_18695, partial [Candidatus Thorarchaeota archaeon]
MEKQIGVMKQSFEDCAGILSTKLVELDRERFVYDQESLLWESIRYVKTQAPYEKLRNLVRKYADKRNRWDLKELADAVLEQSVRLCSRIKEIPNLNPKQIEKGWDELRKCLQLPQFEISYVVPVYWIGSHDISIDIEAGLQIRRATILDKLRMKRHSMVLLYEKDLPNLVIERFNSELPKDMGGENFGEQVENLIIGEVPEMELLGSCFRIFFSNKSHIRAMHVWISQDKWTVTASRAIGNSELSFMRLGEKPHTKLPPGFDEEFRFFWDRFKERTNIESFNRAVRRYDRAIVTTHLEDTLSDVFISLEALYGGSKSDIAYRAASLAGTSIANRQEIH